MTEAVAMTPAERMAHARASRRVSQPEPEIPDEINMAARATVIRDQRNADLAQEARRQAVDSAVNQAREQGVKTPRPEEMTPQARAALHAIELERQKVHAARSALEQRQDPLVKVRITKLGHGKVSTGVHVKGIGDAYFFWKEETEMPTSIAEIHQDRGFVEIED